MERIEKASPEQLAAINQIYAQCKTELLQKGILQWGDWGSNYPHEDYLSENLKSGSLFILKAGNEIIGAWVLNEKQSPEWGAVQWKNTSGKALVIHALVIHPRHQGQGYGRRVMAFCEEYAVHNGYTSIRLDAFPKNAASNRLYQRFGYAYAGKVIFENKPPGNKEYYCYEKVLSRSGSSFAAGSKSMTLFTSGLARIFLMRPSKAGDR